MLDPKTMKYSFVDTCFGTHHLQFDANDRLWTSGGGQVVGWLDMKIFDETGDAAKAQGWTPFILDTNGNGKRDEYVEPNQPVDPTKDKRIAASFYAVMPSPADGSVWGSVQTFPGAVVRVTPGANPSETALAEIYNIPLPGFGIRGADIDKQGVVWAIALERSSRRASIGANARDLSMGRRRPVIIAPRAGRFFNIPVPAFRASARTARSRAITPGWISTTPSAWARTCRCPRPTCTMAWSR